MLALLAFIAAAVPGTVALVEPNGIGRLPALGWNSWNAFGCDINEEKFLTAANKLVELGLKDAGYQYVNIDDCWSVKTGRDNATGQLVPDPAKFPNGIKGTASKIHDLGLSIGIYSSAGTKTCAGYPASIGYEKLDAATWASWGIDYLKYDNCNFPDEWKDSCDACVPDGPPSDYVNGTCTNTKGLCPDGYDYSQSNTAKRFRAMRDALASVSRPILYSLCEWGYAGVQSWGNDTGSSWRSTGDINPTWPRILQILNGNSFYLTHTNFWGHSDADMLEVGNGLTPAQSRSHFSLWAAMKSPLLIGTDLAKLSSDNVAILANKHLLAFHQDPVYGAPATPYKWGTNPDWTFNASFPAEFWAGQSGNGTMVWMFNPTESTAEKTADYGEVPGLEEGATYYVTDVWSGRSTCSTGRSTAEVAAHDTSVLLFQQGDCADEGTQEMVLRAGEWC